MVSPLQNGNRTKLENLSHKIDSHRSYHPYNCTQTIPIPRFFQVQTDHILLCIKGKFTTVGSWYYTLLQLRFASSCRIIIDCTPVSVCPTNSIYLTTVYVCYYRAKNAILNNTDEGKCPKSIDTHAHARDWNTWHREDVTKNNTRTHEHHTRAAPATHRAI